MSANPVGDPLAVRPGQTAGAAQSEAIVIIARTEWPARPLNSVELNTSAGRRLAPGRSEKGKGTTATSPGSQITKRLVILGG
jgi:hypothetical protein